MRRYVGMQNQFYDKKKSIVLIITWSILEKTAEQVQ